MPAAALLRALDVPATQRRLARGRRWLLQVAIVASWVGACRAPAGGVEGAADAAARVPAHRHVLYRITVEPMADAPPLPRIARGYVHVAAVTALRCQGGAATDDAAGPAPTLPRHAPSFAASVWRDALIAPAFAGHGAAGVPPFQLRARRVIALHDRSSQFLGDGEGDVGPLCQIHLLLGRADDAPEPAVPVSIARLALHLDLALATGARTIRTDVAWGHVLPLPAADDGGVAILDVRLDVGAALRRVAAELDLGTAAERDVGRAMLRALTEGAAVGRVVGSDGAQASPAD